MEKKLTCSLIGFNIMGDERGSLIALAEHYNTPFSPHKQSVYPELNDMEFPITEKIVNVINTFRDT